MVCDGCNHEAGRLLVTQDGDLCRSCLKGDLPAGVPGLVVRIGNKYEPKMTHNEAMHIRTRKIGKDGRVHAHWKFETKDF